MSLLKLILLLLCNQLLLVDYNMVWGSKCSLYWYLLWKVDIFREFEDTQFQT